MPFSFAHIRLFIWNFFKGIGFNKSYNTDYSMFKFLWLGLYFVLCTKEKTGPLQNRSFWTTWLGLEHLKKIIYPRIISLYLIRMWQFEILCATEVESKNLFMVFGLASEIYKFFIFMVSLSTLYLWKSFIKNCDIFHTQSLKLIKKYSTSGMMTYRNLIVSLVLKSQHGLDSLPFLLQ